MDEKKINWTQILITAAITGIVTVIAGMILYNLQTSKPKLTFEAPETSPFQGTGQNFSIYNVTISNGGGTSISNITGVIQIPKSSLDDTKITAAQSIKYSTSISGDTLNVEIPDLNPSETVIISILATSKDNMPKKPDVSLRGTGITGVSTSKNVSAFEPIFMIGVLVSFFSLVSSILSGTKLSSIAIAGINIPLFGKGGNVFGGKHSDDQNKVYAYLCGLHGLTNEVDEYLSRQSDTSYWSESDRFAALATLNPESSETEKRKKVLIDLLEYANVADVSKAIIHYNIGRIAFAQNKGAEAKKYLLSAKRIGGKLIETRLKLDSKLQDIIQEK